LWVWGHGSELADGGWGPHSRATTNKCGPVRVTTSGPVLITGCSTGIGRAAAGHLAKAGHLVYATARTAEAIADLRAAGCRTLALDVTDESSMRAAVERVVAEQGTVGVLVNNAGYSQSGAVETVSMEDVRRQFETNVFGLTRMCQLVLPGMRAQGSGRIVNISSMGANFTFPGGGIYHATKYAVEAISDALRFEVKEFGVDVVVIQPGIIRTEFSATAAAEVRSEDGPYAAFNAAVVRSTKSVYQKGPLARLGGGPETVAKTIERAITARSPKIRYRVTPSARLLVYQRRLITDGMWDRFLATQFPRPGAVGEH
jgi:NAD(P)-dependent dehydrogenase (short-subunit alcohol dehydrogenase family)